MSKTICIAGKNNIAINIAKYIAYKYPDYKLIAITNQNDYGNNNFQLSFKHYCEINDIEVVSLYEVYEIENLYFISLEFDKIIKPSRFKSKELFNIHFSYLPAYKGMYTSALPILNNEEYSGVTLHLIDTGIDTGDIIDQEKFKLNPSWTGQDLYLKYIEYGTRIVKKNLENILTGKYDVKVQSHVKSSYYDKNSIDYANLTININKTANEVHNQIRAFSFPAYQLPLIKDSEIYNSIILTSKTVAKPGNILFEDEFSITISTIDFDLKLLKDKRSELLEASKKGDLKLIKKFHANLYPLNQRSKEGWDILILAAYNGHLDIIRWLLEDVGWDVNTTNNNLTSFAMYVMTHASLNNDTSILEYILKNTKGIQWNHKDARGHNINYYAKKLNNINVINLLPCP
ncbi:formyl transferase [Flavobacteriaceae bacterium Ap0902]|nr:formyl transferase [Flavobacteriaceae bacterium Ap0902]